MHQGVGDEFLYLLDLNWRDPETDSPDRLFFLVNDSLDSCGVVENGYSIAGYSESVRFSTGPGSGTVSIVVKARAGKARLPQRVLDACNLDSKPGPYPKLWVPGQKIFEKQKAGSFHAISGCPEGSK